MEGAALDEDTLFATIETSGARALLIGRRAMIVLGIPVMTADYDLWLHIDDVERLNAAMAAIDHHPNCPPDEARRRGRYVFENDEHIDVMIARAATTKTGTPLAFDDAWARRQTVAYGAVSIALPSIADLILTKEWGMRTKDVTDIQLLEALRSKPAVKP
jgi:hypothetical protein